MDSEMFRLALKLERLEERVGTIPDALTRIELRQDKMEKGLTHVVEQERRERIEEDGKLWDGLKTLGRDVDPVVFKHRALIWIIGTIVACGTFFANFGKIAALLR